jgi:DNA-binding transcriptional ArsR family regulator
MSIDIMSWLLRSRPAEMSAAELLVALIMADHAGGDGGHAYPSVARISTLSQLAQSTVRAALDSLEEKGVIAKTHEYTPRRPAVYCFPQWTPPDDYLSNDRESRNPAPSPSVQTSREPKSGTQGAEIRHRTVIEPLDDRDNSSPKGSPLSDNGTVEEERNVVRPSPETSLAQNASGARDRPSPQTPPPAVSNGQGTEFRGPEDQHPYWTEKPKALGIFDWMYNQWPKKTNKLQAMTAFRTVLVPEIRPLILAGQSDEPMNMVAKAVQWQVREYEREGRELKFIPAFAKWIERKGWQDAPQEMLV